MNWREQIDKAMVGVEGKEAAATLKELALADLYSRAGYVPGVYTGAISAEIAPPETQPVCSGTAVAWLEILMSGQQSVMLILTCMYLIGKRGERVPHGMIPQMLKFARANQSHLNYIKPILGDRGRWMVETEKELVYFKKDKSVDTPPGMPTILDQYPHLIQQRDEMIHALAPQGDTT